MTIDRARVQDAFVFACEHHAPRRRVRRGLHRPSGRRGADLRRACVWTPRRSAPRCCTTRSRTPRHRSRRSRERFGEEIAAPGRRRHQADPHPLQSKRRGAGRELPQDDRRDGQGHPGHPHQARRPPAQHAHARSLPQAEADREGPARRSRSTRRSPTASASTRSSGSSRTSPSRPRIRASTSEISGARRQAARRARALRHRGAASSSSASSTGSASQRRDHRARQALLLDLLEDDQEGPRVQRDLRPDRDARHRRHRSRTATARSA